MNKSETFADKIRRLRKEAGLTQAQFAERLLISRDYLSQIENGREPGARLVQQVELLEKVGIPRAADDDSVGTKVGQVEEPSIPHGAIRPNEVPVISWARAGAATSYEEIPRDWQRTIFTMCRYPGSFGIEVEGDSMTPEFRPGDIVVVMPEVEPRNHTPVVAKLKDDGVVLKIFTRSRDGQTITLSSINPAYAPLNYTPDDFHWIYPVHSATRGYWK